MNDEILDIKQAADYMKLSQNTIRRAIKEGLLPAAQLRGKLKVRKSDLDALFRKQQEQPKKNGEEKGT